MEARYWATEGVSPEERWIELPSTATRVRLQVAGDGPPVLFVHGGSVNGTCFAPLVARLDGFRCLVLDRPGCGLSAPVRNGLTEIHQFQSFADTLIADVLDGLGLERAHVVATSLGGYFSLRGAAAHPDRVDRVVELGFPVGAPNGPMPLMMRVAGVRSLGRLMARLPVTSRIARSMIRQLGVRDDRITADGAAWFRSVLNHTRTMRNELDGSPVLHRLRGVNEDVLLTDDLLGRIRVPMHFIWGADDPFGGAAVAAEFVPRIPGATLELVKGSGHVVWLDEPDLVASSTKRFLAGDD